MIGRANGVGPKLAARIANELQGKLGVIGIGGAAQRRAAVPRRMRSPPSPISASSPPKPAPRSTPRRTSSARCVARRARPPRAEEGREMTDAQRLVPLRAAPRRGSRRPGARLGLPLPRLPEAHRQRLLGAGALAGRMRRGRGPSKQWTRTADSGQTTTYHFCPECGSTVHYGGGNFPELIAIPLGALDDPYIVDSPIIRFGSGAARLAGDYRPRRRAQRLKSLSYSGGLCIITDGG